MTTNPPAPQPVPWTRRAALLLTVATFLLILVGGLVTTYRVGMAVQDWPTTFGHSMLSYPLDQMLENTGVAQEHSHRLLGTLVGILSLVALLASASAGGSAARRWMWAALGSEIALVAWVVRTKTVFGPVHGALFALVLVLLALSLSARAERALRGSAVVAHLAIVFQGLLGGTRVLENSRQLAFLHGTGAQLVFVAVVILALVSGPVYRRARPIQAAAGPAVQALCRLAVAATFTQVVLGAWLRHTGGMLPLTLHLICALVATASVLVLWVRMRRLQREVGAEDLAPLDGVRHWVIMALGLQWLLGLGSLAAILLLSGGFEGAVTATEGITATLHVGVGALLLSGTVAALVWSRRLLGAAPAPEDAH